MISKPALAPDAPEATITLALANLQSVPVTSAPDGSLACEVMLPAAGLYQLSVIADAAGFNWDELYIELNLFHNQGQRTGPWDFDLLHQNAPLVPSYWVAVDGKRLGLWFFQRVSLEDIVAKRFRGRMAFHVGTGGRHTLRLVPYRQMAITWLSATLEPDPEDTLVPAACDAAAWVRNCPAAAWARPDYWQALKAKLETTHALYREPLQKLFAWLRRKLAQNQPLRAEDILPLLVLHHLDGDPQALPAALASADAAVALPHWGNPKEDGYSHNGDMGAMANLRALSWAWHSLRDHLGEERRERLRAKLALQGERFFELALLNRDYWGGSVLQDHGKKSLDGFATAALNLLGIVPAAEIWAAYALPRCRRVLAALPRDGAIPFSSYFNLSLYADELTHLRTHLLALNGQDLFDEAPVHAIIDYLCDVVREKDGRMLVSPVGCVEFVGGNAFLNHMAIKYHDGRAARLQLLNLQTAEFAFSHPVLEHAFYHGALWGFLTYSPEVPPVAKLPAARPLQLFEDSALANYRDPAADITLSVHSGPWLGYHAYRRARGPCDRMEMVVGPGHFILARDGRALLVTPDGGYRLRTATRSCLLIDGQGPIGDVGYPMSIPSFKHPGDEITDTRWDAATGSGSIRLELGPAYGNFPDLAEYTRTFLVEAGRRIVCRDRVVLSRPHRLSWHFQGLQENGLDSVGPLQFLFGGAKGFRLEAQTAGLALTASVQPTEVVYSYSSQAGFKPFVHARFETPEPVTAASVDFVFTWT